MLGSCMDFLSNRETPQNEGVGLKSAVSMPLVSQSSVYSLTFQEFQNNLGGSGKDFGSMNMDELLKNIWTAEDPQAMTTSAFVEQGSSNASSGNLQKQGSLTLPRILSQKTVEEVWKELFSENGEVKDVNPDDDTLNFPQQNRQPTFGEVTLEEFLSRAGVVREDAQQMESNDGYYCGGSSQANNTTVTFTSSEPMTNNTQLASSGTRGSMIRIADHGMNNGAYQGGPLGLAASFSGEKMGGSMNSSATQLSPDVTTKSNGDTSSVSPSSYTLGGVSIGRKSGTMEKAMERRRRRMIMNQESASRGSMNRIGDHGMNNGAYQGGPLGMAASFSGEKMGGAMNSPANQLSPDVTTKSNGDTSSVSPPSYMLGGVSVGRKSGTMEKAMERRQRRMIKNRESASRSRARKQAYTFELEAEVAKLKDMNNELRKKQDEITEKQHNQALEKMKIPSGSKRQCLRRTLTPPW